MASETLTGDQEDEAPLDFPKNKKRQADQNAADSERNLPKDYRVKRIVIKGRYWREIRNKKGRIVHRRKWTQKKTNKAFKGEYIDEDKRTWFTRYWISILIKENSKLNMESTQAFVFSYNYGRTLKGRLTVQEMREVSPQGAIALEVKDAKAIMDGDRHNELTLEFNSEYIEWGSNTRPPKYEHGPFRAIIPGYRERHVKLTADEIIDRT